MTTCRLVIDGSPDQYGVSSPNGYGINVLVEGSDVTEEVTSPVAVANGERVVCTGWTGGGNVPVNGTSNSVSFALNQDSTLTWQWLTEYYLDTGTVGAGSGLVDVGDGWHVSGEQVVLTADPDGGCYFAGWTGDVPAGQETANPLTVTMDKARTITAEFGANGYTVAGKVYYSGSQSGVIRIEAFDDSGYTHKVGQTQITKPGSYHVDGLPGGRDYWMRAYRDTDGDGKLDAQEPVGGYAGNPIEDMSSNVGAVDIYMQRLSAPSGVEARGSISAVMLNWRANAESGVAGYNVYRFDSSFGRFERLNTAPIEGLAFTDGSVIVGEVYYYYVTAVVQSEFMSSYMESLASSIVAAAAGDITLWMPDYNGQAGSQVRLRLNVSDAHGLLGEDMKLGISYNPALLTPLAVEKTALTEGLTISNNVGTAAGVVEIASQGSGGSNATLKVLGCAYESSIDHPVAIEGKFSLNGGTTWLWLNDGQNINNGQSYSVDLGPVSAWSNCIVQVKELYENHVRQSNGGTAYVKVLRNGDSIADVPGIVVEEDMYYYLRPYVDAGMRVSIGPADALYLFELGDALTGETADYQDVVMLVEFNEGSTLVGQGHLFDVVFQVAPGATLGAKQTNAFTEVIFKDQSGQELSVSSVDTAVFTVQSAYCLGDLNGNGVVDPNVDYSLAMELAVGLRLPTTDQLTAGDIDGDGKFTKFDATLIKRLALGLSINPEEGGGSGGGTEPGGYELSIGSYEAERGQLVQVPVLIDNASAVAALDMRVNFDRETFSFMGVTNGPVTAGFGLAYREGAGYVDIVMTSSNQLISGSGTLLILEFYVQTDAEVGAISGLTLASRGLGNQYGKDLEWTSGVTSQNGSIGVVLSKVTDSDGDGVSDYLEQFLDGGIGYNPWSLLGNPYGTDTDVLVGDTDSDGMDDGDEVFAGTSGVDVEDVLEILKMQWQGGVRLEWPTKGAKVYDVQRSLTATGTFTAVTSNIPGSGSSKAFTDTSSYTRPRFYRIRVR